MAHSEHNSLCRDALSNQCVDRLSKIAGFERRLLPQQTNSGQHQLLMIFVLHGFAGIGKTQFAADFSRRHQTTFGSVFWLDWRSEYRLRQSITIYAQWNSNGQIPDRDNNHFLGNENNLKVVVADVLEWLMQPENTDWLLIFDNIEQDYEQGGKDVAYDIRQYLHSDHGSVLITTLLSRLAQLGDSKGLTKIKQNYLPELVGKRATYV